MWCDVVPMDVCHILLGRPWQYNRHVIHNGHQNTCTSKMGKYGIVILSSKKEKLPKSLQEEGNNFLILSKFVKESKEGGIA